MSGPGSEGSSKSKKSRLGNGLDTNPVPAALRLVAALPLFVAAAWLAHRSWRPLGNGYFSEYPDDPTGLYFTIAGVGASVAAIALTAGVLLVWPRFRRRGGFIVLSALAVIASITPYFLFKWTSRPDTWPWAYFVQNATGWLGIEPRSRGVGVEIQVALAVIAGTSLAAHFLIAHGRRGDPG
jgi:hypothetical protein